MDLYAENILDHYRHPHHKSPLPRREGVITHSELNPACGDEITIGVNIQDGTIQNIQWDGNGCAISQAAMSMLSEEMTGKTPSSIELFTKEDVFHLLGVPISPRRMQCALLGLHTMKNALRKTQGESLRGWIESVL